MAATTDGANMSDTEAAAAAVEAPAPPAAKNLSLTLKVHEIAKDAQNQNGLRHGDYHQYRQYCTRRLKRVRSSRQVRFMFGKGKSFVQKVRWSALLFIALLSKRAVHTSPEDDRRVSYILRGCCSQQAEAESTAQPPSYDHGNCRSFCMVSCP